MNLLNEFFSIMPIVMITGVVMIIISFCLKNKRISKILFIIGISVPSICIYFLMAIIVPYTFMSSMFEGIEGYFWMFAIAILIWLIVTIFIRLKNIIIFKNNKEKAVYIRDIDVKYSPAVCSYLMNNKIETKKDLTATLLNLCAKKIVKIEKNEKNINIIDLKNKEQVEELSEDEKYAYKMLISKITSSKLTRWKNKVEDEYVKYKFSKKHKRFLGEYIMWLYVALFVIIFSYFIITGETIITGNAGEILAKLMITIFITAWEVILMTPVIAIVKGIIKGNNSDFGDTYTSKGAREFNKWKKFIDFMKDYSLIDEKTDENIEIWGKYLSYSIALGINRNCDKELYKKIQKEYSFEFDIFTNISEDVNN